MGRLDSACTAVGQFRHRYLRQQSEEANVFASDSTLSHKAHQQWVERGCKSHHPPGLIQGWLRPHSLLDGLFPTQPACSRWLWQLTATALGGKNPSLQGSDPPPLRAR